MGNKPSSSSSGSRPNRRTPSNAAMRLGSSYSKSDAPPPPYYSKSSDPGHHTGGMDKPPLNLRSGGEDALETLSLFDTWFLVDDSESMSWSNHQRWYEARDALSVLADTAARYDQDGIDVFFLNNVKAEGRGLTSAQDVSSLFNRVQPRSATPIARRLEEILGPYVRQVETCAKQDRPFPKPRNLLIITDGEPTDDPESAIASIAKRLDQVHAPLTQLGIQFVQVGDDAKARRYLEELDDELANIHKIRDMVDTTASSKLGNDGLSGDALVKVLVGAVNRRIDRKGYGSLQ